MGDCIDLFEVRVPSCKGCSWSAKTRTGDWARPLGRGVGRLSIALALAFASGCAAADGACRVASLCAAELRLSSGGSAKLYRSLPLTPNPAVRRTVLVVHGNRRDAGSYFEWLVAATAAEERLSDTLLLAPGFQTLADERGDGEHYWSEHGWKRGNRSIDAARISSFTIMDQILERVCPVLLNDFPSLETVVIVGHSAGGQFVNRYLAGGSGCANSEVEVRYVVMNPSSYLYIDARRWSDEAGRFESKARNCTGFDDYKYGLRDLNSYMRRVGESRIRSNLFTRRAFYLAGSEDRGDRGGLDDSCRGNLQGADRLARQQNYRAYSDLFAEWTESEFDIVPGVGHHASEMLMSEVVRSIVFE